MQISIIIVLGWLAKQRPRRDCSTGHTCRILCHPVPNVQPGHCPKQAFRLNWYIACSKFAKIQAILFDQLQQTNRLSKYHDDIMMISWSQNICRKESAYVLWQKICVSCDLGWFGCHHNWRLESLLSHNKKSSTWASLRSFCDFVSHLRFFWELFLEYELWAPVKILYIWVVACYGYRFWGAYRFPGFCGNQHIRDPTWSQNPFLNRLGNGSSSCFVGFKCFGNTSCSFRVAFICMHVPFICMHLPLIVHSFPFMSLSCFFHWYSCPFIFLSYSFHVHSNVHSCPLIFLSFAHMFLSFFINVL